MGPSTKQVVKRVNDPRGRGRVCERDMAHVRVGHGMASKNYCVVGGCLLSLSLCRRGFQDLLKVRPSSYLHSMCKVMLFVKRSKHGHDTKL